MPLKTETEQKINNYDVVIAGAGYVGLTAAVAIKSARPDMKLLVVDAAPEGVWKKDVRAIAVAADACRMLRQLGCWDGLIGKVQPINEMVITDSRVSDPVRPVFLTFAGDVTPGEPFAHMVETRDLGAVLRKRADELGLEIREGVAVERFDIDPAAARIHLADGTELRARLLIAADGKRSKLRTLAGIRTIEWEYGQSGIVCTVAHERPHHGRAEEHFLPAGPFAILPLTGNRSSIVWTERTEDAERLINEDDVVFEYELEQRFGLKLGEIHVEGPRRAFPLTLLLARDFVKPRFALAGDAAHGVHPIAGQGLNLGFKDVAALAEVIVEAERLGEDIGALNVLQRYERWRRFDTVQMGVTTDVLNRLFSNDWRPVRAVRDFGLGLVDRLPGLKSFFIRQASGLVPNSPRLLRGEAI